MYKAIIVDIDGTLADCEHRRRAATKDDGKMDWKVFYEGMIYDPVNEWCRKICKHFFMDDSYVILVSGRPEDYWEITVNWLDCRGVYYDRLLMRPSGDYRSDVVVKTEIYQNHIQGVYDVLFCVDDRQQVVDMWRGLGLVCLQCAPGNF